MAVCVERGPERPFVEFLAKAQELLFETPLAVGPVQHRSDRTAMLITIGDEIGVRRGGGRRLAATPVWEAFQGEGGGITGGWAVARPARPSDITRESPSVPIRNSAVAMTRSLPSSHCVNQAF